MVDAPLVRKTVIVAGNGRGLGPGIARRFGQAGAHVVIADTDARTGEDAARVLQGEGLSVSYEKLDLRDQAQVTTLVEKVVGDRERIDVWVNNLSVARKGAAEALSHEAWQESVDTILSGSFYCSQAVGRHMLAQGRGVIANVTSVNGYQAIEGSASSCAAHAGLVMLTKALGIEWASRGVRVVGIAPGALATDFRQDGANEGSDVVRAYERRTPLKRIATVDEVAEAILYLTGEEASYVTAETMRVDGGWTAYQLF
jgi:NAD(P)-dependent dehydrogenase (short-subunit alcohol dehydrogenase family)